MRVAIEYQNRQGVRSGRNRDRIVRGVVSGRAGGHDRLPLEGVEVFDMLRHAQLLDSFVPAVHVRFE